MESLDKENFQGKVRNIYKSQDKITPLIEGLNEIPQQSMKDYYVRLQIIMKEDDEKKHGKYEEIYGEKKEVELEEIFEQLTSSDGQKAPGRILIVGGAGVGKSTLMQHMAYKWSIGELWNDKFDYVYRITLKTLLNTEWKSAPWSYTSKEKNENLLKCLAHYNLTKGFKSKNERQQLIPDDIPWSTDERTLLLLDGYDEIAHLEDDPDYQTIYEEIFEHKRVIFSSRPNAINHDMRANFDRVVENIGLDSSGIQQYFKQYFKNNVQKGEELDKFLSSNAIIKGICKIPVNIAMLCYIWSEANSDDKLDEISSVSDLYQEIVDRLAKRFIDKKWRGAKIEGVKRNDKLTNGPSNLDELKVLTHVAYKGMTGGGIDIADKDRVETLIIKGAQDKDRKKDLKDEDGISIQSSINYLSRRQKIQGNSLEKVDIGSVYKFGLLRTEGANASSASESHSAAEKEYLETDLQKQNYSFIHLTFQEYLAAAFLKDWLRDGNEQEKSSVCQYIAEHRNEPRYLMTLKLMAGQVTSEHGEAADQVTAMFWDSMICNVDGVIELGAETKISLLMHLLSQAKVPGGELDPRIPNREEITNLIDFVVLNDFLNWGTQLKESDFTSNRIKEGLIKAIVEDSLQWHATKITEICEKFSPALKNAALRTILKATDQQQPQDSAEGGEGRIFARALEMASDLAAKLDHCEHLTIIKRLKEIIRTHEDKRWQLTRYGLEGLIKFISHVKLGREDYIDLIEGLVQLIVNTKLKQQVLDAIYMLIKTSKDEEIKILTLEQIWNFYPVKKKNTDALDAIIHLVRAAKDKDMAAKAIQLFRSLLTDEDKNLKKIGVKAMPSLAKAVAEDKESATKALELFGSFVTGDDVEISEVTTKAMVKMAKVAKDKELATKVLNHVRGLLAHGTAEVRTFALDAMVHLVNAMKDKEITTKDLEQISNLLADDDEKVKSKVVFNMSELIKGTDDKEAVGKVFQQLSKFLAHDNVSVRKAALKTIQDLVTETKDKEVATKALEQIRNLLADSAVDIRSTALTAIADLIQVAKDKEIATKAIEQVSKLFADDNASVRGQAATAMVELVKATEDKTIIPVAILNIWKLLLDRSDDVRTFAIDAMIELVKAESIEIVSKAFTLFSMLLANQITQLRKNALYAMGQLVTKIAQSEEIVARAFAEISPLLSSPDIGQNAINSLFDIVYATKDKELATKAAEDIINLLAQENTPRVQATAVEVLQVIVDIAENEEIAARAFEQVSILLANSKPNQKFDLMLTMVKLIEAAKDKRAAVNAIEQVSAFIASEDEYLRRMVIEAISQFVKVAEDKESATKTLEQVKSLLTDESEDVRGETAYAMMEIAKVVDMEMTAQILDQITSLLQDKDELVQECAIDAITKLVKAMEDKEDTIRRAAIPKIKEAVVKALSLLAANYENLKNEAFSFMSAATKNFLLSPKDLLEYLQHYNPNFRANVVKYFISSFQTLSSKFSQTDELLKNRQGLDIKVINETLFDNQLEQTSQDEITKIISKVKEDNNPATLAQLKETLLSRLNYLGHRKAYELIESTLAIIGYEVVAQGSPKKELVDLASKIIEYIVNSCLNDEGLEWINQHFDILTSLSKESKHFLKKLYQKFLEDSHISALKEKLIIKFINYGFTTSITRAGKIIFEGKKYSIQSTNTDSFLEKMTRAVINQERDILAFQYKQYQPIFPKSAFLGMKTAATDIEAVCSLVEKSQSLSNDSWLLTRLQEENGNKIELLEQRSVIGDYLIYQVNKRNLIRIHPVDMNKKLQEIFGDYSRAKRYQGGSKVLEINEGNKIINGSNSLDLKIQESKQYFQQELVGQGNTDRIDYMSSELNNKLTDYAKVMNNKLKKDKISPTNQNSVKEYYHAFTGTFAMVYETSHIIDSGCVKLDTDDVVTNVLSTIVSFAPFVGENASNVVTWIGGALKTQEMKKSAIKMKKLSPDIVGLNQMVGELACKIISFPQKQHQITSITKEDLQKISGNLLERTMKLFSNLEKKVDKCLYGEQYETAAAQLGHDDANTLIEHWVKGKIEQDTLQDEFLKLALPNIELPSGSSSSVKITGERGSNCCQTFAVPYIKYDNPLFNQRGLLQIFLAIYGAAGVNKLIELQSKIGAQAEYAP